eukprot:11199086-Lingulodinium_polyedra.AAC.1
MDTTLPPTRPEPAQYVYSVRHRAPVLARMSRNRDRRPKFPRPRQSPGTELFFGGAGVYERL